MILKKESTILASTEDVFAWHTRPSAFDRLVPPWESVNIVSESGSFESKRVIIKMKRFGVPIMWTAQHEAVNPPNSFVDRQVSGPFASWVHRHNFESMGPSLTKMVDTIQYQLPLISAPFASRLVKRDLTRLLNYRHKIVGGDLDCIHTFPVSPQVIAISGSTGLIGRHLVSFLRAAGHTVKPMIRSDAPLMRDDAIAWSPDHGILDDFSDVHIIIHLAGESIASPIRWTKKKKQRIVHSRVHATSVLCQQLAKSSHNIHTFIAASAIGIYPDSHVAMTETSKKGTGFMSQLVTDWEAACDPIRESVRVCHARFGIVLHPSGGMMKTLYPILKLGGLGPIGGGRQWMSWIALDDAIRAVYAIMAKSDIIGPVNIVAQSPMTQQHFVSDWARECFRPAKVPLPKWVVDTGMGEMGQQLLLRSSKVLPTQLTKHMFHFQCETIKDVCQLYFKL